jgi:hypothetical protein
MNIRLWKRRERWALTVQGKILIFFCLLALITLAVKNVYPFLAVNKPVRGQILVIEGWLPDYVLEKAIVEFRKNNYKLLITAGMPMSKGSYLSQYKNYAEVSAATLKRLGFDEDRIVTLRVPLAAKERTYATALAVKKWLLKSDYKSASLDVYSLGVHGRRTWLLFEKAVGNGKEVGILTADDLGYDPNAWWKSSEGVRNVISELIAYLYVRIFFFFGGGEA